MHFLLISWSYLDHIEINLKPRFSIKSGYYIVPSSSTALVFMSLETWYSPCSNSTSTDHLDKIERCRSVVSEKIPFDIINNYFSIGVVSKTMAKVCILWCLSQFKRLSNEKEILSFDASIIFFERELHLVWKQSPEFYNCVLKIWCMTWSLNEGIF